MIPDLFDTLDLLATTDGKEVMFVIHAVVYDYKTDSKIKQTLRFPHFMCKSFKTNYPKEGNCNVELIFMGDGPFDLPIYQKGQTVPGRGDYVVFNWLMERRTDDSATTDFPDLDCAKGSVSSVASEARKASEYWQIFKEDPSKDSIQTYATGFKAFRFDLSWPEKVRHDPAQFAWRIIVLETTIEEVK